MKHLAILSIFVVVLSLVLVLVSAASAGWFPQKINQGLLLQSDGKTNNGQALLAIQTIGNATVGPEASNDDRLLLAGSTTNITSWKNYTASVFVAQPDYARTILLTPSKSTNGTAVVTGTDMNNAAITESYIWAASGSAFTTTRAFKTVTKLSFLNYTTGTTFKVGTNDKLGLNCKLGWNSVSSTLLDGVLESTAASVTTSATVLSLNTIDLNSAYSGKPVKVYYLVTA